MFISLPQKKKRVSLDMSKNIQVNLIEIKYNKITYGIHKIYFSLMSYIWHKSKILE